MRLLIAVLFACSLCLACSDDDTLETATGPTHIAASAAAPVATTNTATASSSYEGTWRGTYEDVACSPQLSLCRGSMRPNSHSIVLTLRIVAGSLMGSVSSGDLGFGHNAPSFPVTGVIDSRGQLQLQGTVNYSSRCGMAAPLGSPPHAAQAGVEILGWALRFDGRRLTGAFRRAATNTYSGCNPQRFVIDSRIPWMEKIS